MENLLKQQPLLCRRVRVVVERSAPAILPYKYKYIYNHHRKPSLSYSHAECFTFHFSFYLCSLQKILFIANAKIHTANRDNFSCWFTLIKLEHLHCLRVSRVYLHSVHRGSSRFIRLVLSHVYLFVFVAHDFDRANSFCMMANCKPKCTNKILLNLELNNQHTNNTETKINNFMMN